LIVAREKAEYSGWARLPEQKTRPGKRPAGQSLVRKEKLLLAGLVLVFFCSCAVIAFYYAQVLVTGYRLNQAQKELALLRKESHDLYAEVNELASLENIEYIAVHKLGMVRPQNDRVVLVQKVDPAEQAGKSSAVAADAVAAGAPVNEKEQAAGQERREENWVIRAFADMVGRLEASINTG